MAACALVEMAASVKEKPGTQTMIEMFASFASLMVQVANWLATSEREAG
jgi:hypothetical protein